MIILVYPGLVSGKDIKNKDKKLKAWISSKFWWTTDTFEHNNTYLHDYCSAVLFDSENGHTVIAEAQPQVREYICANRGNEKVCIIFPSLEMKDKHIERMKNIWENMSDDILTLPQKDYYYRALEHVEENFDYDIRAIMYESSYNRKWYDKAYAIKDENFDIEKIIKEMEE